MDAFEALILGIVQGITEWLPVSSSGHLVIFQELLGVPADENLLFDLVVHFGTIMAVMVYFRKELWRIIGAALSRSSARTPEQTALQKLGLLLILGTIPIGVAGVLLNDWIESVFNIQLVGVALVANGIFLLTVSRFASKGVRKTTETADALTIGLAQIVSILPGISRSGSTLGTGMIRGLEREAAAVFAFLLSVPTMLGAFAYGMLTLDRYDTTALNSAIGLASAFAVGLISIGFLLRAVKTGRLWTFGAYCLVVGALVAILTSM